MDDKIKISANNDLGSFENKGNLAMSSIDRTGTYSIDIPCNSLELTFDNAESNSIDQDQTFTGGASISLSSVPMTQRSYIKKVKAKDITSNLKSLMNPRLKTAINMMQQVEAEFESREEEPMQDIS